MVYGAFFYPLYSLAAEQLWRVAHAAALARYRQLGGPSRRDGRPVSFGRRVRWLARRGAVPADRVARWDGFGELRNAASHREFQSIFMPGDALVTLRVVTEAIGQLFSGSATEAGTASGRYWPRTRSIRPRGRAGLGL